MGQLRAGAAVGAGLDALGAGLSPLQLGNLAFKSLQTVGMRPSQVGVDLGVKLVWVGVGGLRRSRIRLATDRGPGRVQKEAGRQVALLTAPVRVESLLTFRGRFR